MAFGTADKPSVPRPIPPPPPPPAAAVPRPPAATADRGGFSGLRVSLMPSDMEGGQGPDLRRGLLILVFVLVLETIIIGGINFWLLQNTTKRQAERAALDQRISDIKKAVEEQGKSLQGAIQLDRQIKAVKDGLDQHVYWTEFFAFLENNSRPNVRFLRFSGEAETGIFSIDILGKSYRDIAEQIVAFRDNPKVVSVRATSASAKTNQLGEIEGVSTSMMVKMDTSVWLRPLIKTAP